MKPPIQALAVSSLKPVKLQPCTHGPIREAKNSPPSAFDVRRRGSLAPGGGGPS